MRLEGTPTVVDFDPYQTQAAGAVTGPVTGSQFQYTTTHNVGEAARLADGRTFRYVLAGAAATVAGTTNTPAAEKTNHAEINPSAAISSFTSVNQVSLTLGATAATLNEYAHGFATFSSGGNVGISYEVSYHPAIASSGTGLFTFFDFLQAAVLTADTVDLNHSQWYNIIQSTGSSDQTIRCAGVTPVVIAAAYGGWSCTHGLVGCLADGTVAVGTEVVLSNSTAGAVTGRSTTWSTAIAQVTVGVCSIGSAIATNSKPIFILVD